MKTRIRSFSFAWYMSATFLLLASAVTVRAEAGSEERVSITSQGQEINRSVVEDSAKSLDELKPLIRSGSRSKSTRASGQQAPSGRESSSGERSPNVDFWFFDASVELFSDFDHDGHYAGVDVTFDADTIYTAADVYAVLYLSYNFGPWNEYASTEDFTLYGASGEDEYFVETELVSGYPTGDYDILIELFDAYDGTFVASFGPDDSTQLSHLPLEDAGRDAPQATVVIVNNGGGGSLGLLSLLALLGVAGWVRARPALSRL